MKAVDSLKRYIHGFTEKLGIKFYKIPKDPGYGKQEMDMKRLLNEKDDPVIFDVGANNGQSIILFKNRFPGCIIYAFEPGTEAFQTLEAKYGSNSSIHLNNIAVGSEKTRMEFNENTFTYMSSFLEIDRTGWGEILNKKTVEVTTIDLFCKENGILNIDVLKCDTQGFDFEVFKGASKMLNNVKLVYFEFTFSDMYKGLPHFDEVYKFLTDHNFRLANLYDIYYQDGLLSWTDFLFINRKCLLNEKI